MSVALANINYSRADSFDKFMELSDEELIGLGAKMEKEPKAGCDTHNRTYQVRTEWLGDHWVVHQEYCDVVPCSWLNGKDPKKYCKE